MRLPGLTVGFAPWVLFLVMPHRTAGTSFLFSAVVATGVAVAAAWWTRGRSGPKLLSISAVPTFTAVSVLAAASTGSAQQWLVDYTPSAVLFVLATVMFASLLSAPFTEQYAREALPDEYWHSPHLHQLNTRLSLVWALCTAAAASSVMVASLVPVAHSTGLGDLLVLSLQWLLPVVVTAVACRYTAATR